MTSARHTVKNRLWVIVVLVLPVFIVLGVYLPLADQLPELIATHWSSTYPDEFTRTEVLVPVSIGLTAVGSLVALSSLALARRPAVLLVLLFIGSLLAWTTAGIFVGSVMPTVLAETPQEAVIGIWMLPMVLFTLVALTPLWICGVYQSYSKQLQEQRQARINGVRGITSPAPQGTELQEGEEFKETMAAPWWLWMLGLVVSGIGVFALFDSYNRSGHTDWTATIISVVVCLTVCPLVLGLCWIRVSITEKRTKVSSALLGFPLRTIQPDQIKSVTSTEIDPMTWGGWGWRIFPGGSAVVLRRHEGLAFELTNSSRFAVTIPNSCEGAKRLNAILLKNGS